MRAPSLALLLLAIIPACGTQSTRSPVGTLEVKAAIDSLWTAYARASDRKDAAAFGALFAEDAVLVTSGASTVRGREAIQSYLASFYAGIDPTGMRVEADQTGVWGSIAIQSGTFEENFLEKNAPMTRYGRFELVAEPEKGKAWKIQRLVALFDSTVAAP